MLKLLVFVFLFASAVAGKKQEGKPSRAETFLKAQGPLKESSNLVPGRAS